MKGRFFLLLALSSLIFATETGKIRGRVTDSAGLPLPGVKIVLKGKSIQGERHTLSLRDGSFILPLLPPGKYELHLSLEGYSPVVLKNVVVSLGKETFLRIRMEAKALREEVTVEAEAPPSERFSTDTSYEVGKDELEVLPTSGRDPVDLTKFVPGVVGVRASTRRGRGRGLPVFRGEGEEGNNWLVDGLSVRGVRLANQGIAVNYDAIEQIQIISDPFSPDLASAFGGVINIITKSGGEEFHGEAGLLFTDQALQAAKLPQLSISFEPESFSHYNGYFNFGGPLIRNKLWFFISDDVFWMKDTTKGQNLDYLFIPAGERERIVNSLFLKFSYSPVVNHNIYLTYMNRSLARQKGGLGVVEARRREDFSEGILILNYKGVFSPSFYLEASLGYASRSSFFEPASGDLGPALYFVEDIAQNIHNALGRTTDKEGRRNFVLRMHYLYSSASLGSHEISAGLEYQYQWSRFQVNFSGRDEDPFPGNGFDNGTKFSFRSWKKGQRTPVLLWEYGPFSFINSVSSLGFYLMDRFTYGRLTLMAGLRSYIQNNYDSQGKLMWRWGISDFLSPRIFLSLDLTGDGRNVIKAGWGIFKDITTTLHLGFFNPQAPVQFRRYIWKGPENPTQEELHNPENWEFLNEERRGPYEINPTLKPNSLTRFLLEYDRVLGRGWVLKARLVKTEARNLLELVGYFDPEPPYYKFVFENFRFKRRDYLGMEVELNGALGKILIFNASYSHSRARGTNPGQVETGSWSDEEGGTYYISLFGKHIYVPDLPELQPLRELFDWGFGGLGGPMFGDEGWYGKLPYSVDHVAKINAIIFGPWGIVFSVAGAYLSGYHWEKRGLVPFFGYYAFPEGRGSRTTPPHFYLDLGIEKEIPILSGYTVGLRLDLFNLFNSQKPVSYVREDTPAFGKIWGRQQPRQARVSIIIRW